MAWYSKDKFSQLRKRLGKDRVITTPETLALYGVDATSFRGVPSAVVFAHTTEDIQGTVDFAREAGMSITPRGRGSGMSGGSVPSDGSIVLTCEKMSGFIKFDKENKSAIIQPGVVTKELQDAVARHDLFYPPDPSSYSISSIGGNVAENAGGLRCFKYGVTGHYINGLEYIDATGEIKTTGVFSNSVFEPDLTSLLVGSEGTLGIFSKVGVRLIPAPEHTQTLTAIFETSQKGFNAIEAIITSGIVPSVMEFIDKRALAAAASYTGVTFPPEANALALLELDGTKDEVEELLPKVLKTLGNYSISHEIAENDSHRERLWQLRRAISPSLARITTGKIHEDIAVPRGKLSEMARRVDIVAMARKLEIAVYGHAGDGNLHIVIMFDKGDASKARVAREAANEIFKSALAYGGTITGEHGVGISKLNILNWQLSEDVVGISRQIKELFDPTNLFNPGKIFNSNRTAR